MENAQQNPVQIPAAPAAAPRAVGSRASRQSWFESAVRFWWVSALFLLVVAIFFLGARLSDWMAQRKLIDTGNRTEALVFDDTKIYGRNAPRSKPLYIQWKVDGKQYEVLRQLTKNTGTIETGTPIEIAVDPKNPHNWIEVGELPPVMNHIYLGLVLLPITVLLGVVAYLRRRRVLGVWADGQPMEAMVISTENSAGPGAYQVRCTSKDAHDKRILRVRYPKRFGKPAKGDTIWVISTGLAPNIILSAAAYQD